MLVGKLYIPINTIYLNKMNIRLKVASSSKVENEEPSPSERIERKKERVED